MSIARVCKSGLLFCAFSIATTGYAGDDGKSQFVDIKSVVSSVAYDIRYAGDNNFVGTQIDGYVSPKCYLHRQAIDAVRAMAEELAAKQMRLKFFDCYRPEKAVAHFMRWAEDLNDTSTKSEYYPNLPKSALVGPYIAARSGHSRGFTIDVTVEVENAQGKFQELDMGSPYDLFDPVSNTAHPAITDTQKKNRYLLKTLMEKHGFSAYDMEWWHFTYASMSAEQKQQYYDFDVN